MAKFEPVESMEYDLSRWTPEGDPTGVGEVPEPSQDMIATYNEEQVSIQLRDQQFTQELLAARSEKQKAWLAEHEGETEAPAAEILKWVQDDYEQRERHRRQQQADFLQSVSTVVQGYPSREVLAALPHRQLAGFAGWLAGQLSPKAWSADTEQ